MPYNVDTAAERTENAELSKICLGTSLEEVPVIPPETSSSFEVTEKPLTLGDLAANVKRILTSPSYHMEYPSCTYNLKFENAVAVFGKKYFARELGHPRAMLRLESAFLRHVQQVHLPPAIFRWLLGIPDLRTEFRYSTLHINAMIKRLNNLGIEPRFLYRFYFDDRNGAGVFQIVSLNFVLVTSVEAVTLTWRNIFCE
ncbi:hypothetical protein BDU57DRAFT_540711 [Ampelomyces quisqualis]|uniref:Uncharacterized protein n=1 Tax=Ampelomyces quisqualis TaxID=50730 RepID=A0A6A5QJ47_AMPQU|nr:hypothetical protein BDU57DRAFT_540711 [Ampelomyces quisqualis]